MTSPSSRRSLAERMESRGVNVDTASSGPEALEKVKDNAYDAMILDLAMPEMDGIETMRHLVDRQSGPSGDPADRRTPRSKRASRP